VVSRKAMRQQCKVLHELPECGRFSFWVTLMPISI
jgi:hypothetical protein